MFLKCPPGISSNLYVPNKFQETLSIISNHFVIEGKQESA